MIIKQNYKSLLNFLKKEQKCLKQRKKSYGESIHIKTHKNDVSHFFLVKIIRNSINRKKV